MSPGEPIGSVAALARYPVKSMTGEPLAQATVEERGLAGDRVWAAYTADGGIGSGKTTRRFRRVDGLLGFRARMDDTVPEDTVPVIEPPAGRPFRADDPAADRLLGDALGRTVALRREDGVPHHDEAPVHVVTTSALRALERRLGRPVDPARFRPNVVLDTLGADERDEEWSGRAVRLGPDVVLRLGPAMPRCVMVDLPQRTLPRDGRILKALGTTGEPVFGLQAAVLQGGTVRVGDPVRPA